MQFARDVPSLLRPWLKTGGVPRKSQAAILRYAEGIAVEMGRDWLLAHAWSSNADGRCGYTLLLLVQRLVAEKNIKRRKRKCCERKRDAAAIAAL